MLENGWESWGKHVLEELTSHSDRLDNIDVKLGNHVTHIEHRLTKIEANHKTLKWLLGAILFSLVITIVSVIATSYLG